MAAGEQYVQRNGFSTESQVEVTPAPQNIVPQKGAAVSFGIVKPKNGRHNQHR